MPNNEAPLSVTMKPHTGYDAPLFTIRADTPDELQTRLAAIEQGGILDTIGRIAASFGAKFQLGSQLGGTTMGDPVQAQPVAPDAGSWGAPADNPANGWGGQTAQPVQQQPVQQPYTPPAPAAQAAMPGAPMILGMPAKMVNSKPGAQRAWRAWADPRPQSAIAQGAEKTNDPNDPRLASGQASFWAFIN